MAGLQWARPRTMPVSPAAASWLRRAAGRFADWEDWLTLSLALGAVLSVSLALEEAGWSRHMPALALVGVLALLAAMFLARSPLWMLLAWLLAAVAGAAVTFWQTMEMVGPGNLEERVDAIYFRFQTWFHLAFTGGISNDPLPFNVMVVGLTWLGVFLFGWSLYRWHNAWLGLIPGGVALFLDMVFVGDSLPTAIFFYALFGSLLVMRANLMARMRRWRAEGVRYPPLISLSFLHYSVWAVLFLILAAWIAPTGPFPTPKAVDALVQRFEGLGVHFVRLAGPLHVKKIIPVHDYTAILPFQGSINLGERHLLSVTLDDPSLAGPIMLRGAVYDDYSPGGWKAGPRWEAELAPGLEAWIRRQLAEGSLQGQLLPLTVVVQAESVVGTVLFSPGEPVSANVPAQIDVPAGSPRRLVFASGEADPAEAPSDTIVIRGDGESGVFLAPLDAAVVRPQERLRKGESYRVLGLIRGTSPDELREAGWAYPPWVRQRYLQLPDNLPGRVSQLAQDVAGNEATPYDRAKAIESYLREYPVNYAVADTPPGKDTVDHFLFESRQGYFNYHASAMVVMLRAVGVPSRLAVGFVVDESDRDPTSGAYAVRDRNAYAWVEVYFPGHGWAPFNPSPDRPADLLPGERSDDLPTGLEGLEGISLPPVGIEDLFPPVPEDPGVASGILGRSISSDSGPGYRPWIALGVIAFVAGLAGSMALGWRRSVAGLPYPQQLWEKTVRLASWAGQPPQPGQTPTDFAAHLERSFRGVPDIPLLAASYNRSRFGHRQSDEEENQRLRRLWPHLRGALLGAILGRAWRRR